MKGLLLGVAALALTLAAGSSSRADIVLGVSVEPDGEGRGLKVVGVADSGVARFMGLRVGDVISQCNGHLVATACELNVAVLYFSAVDRDNPNRFYLTLVAQRADGSVWHFTASLLGTDGVGAAVAGGPTRVLGVQARHATRQEAAGGASALTNNPGGVDDLYPYCSVP